MKGLHPAQWPLSPPHVHDGRSGSTEAASEMGILVQMICWRLCSQEEPKREGGKQDRTEEEAKQRCGFHGSLASAQDHGELWSVKGITGLSLLEPKSVAF